MIYYGYITDNIVRSIRVQNDMTPFLIYHRRELRNNIYKDYISAISGIFRTIIKPKKVPVKLSLKFKPKHKL